MLLIAAVLVVLGAVWLYLFGKDLMADSARDALVEVIEESAIQKDEQQEMIVQIDRLAEGFKAGSVGYGAMAQILTELAEGPVMAVLAVIALETNYVLPSGLSEEEKAGAHLTLERVARGLVEETITEEDLDHVLEVVSIREGEDGERVLKDELTDEELREFLIRARALADTAGVPEEPIEVDLGDALREAIDRALQADSDPEADNG